jgi:hypothetical protein
MRSKMMASLQRSVLINHVKEVARKHAHQGDGWDLIVALSDKEIEDVISRRRTLDGAVNAAWEYILEHRNRISGNQAEQPVVQNRPKSQADREGSGHPRLQTLKLVLEIMAIAITVISGVLALIWRSK